MTVGHVSNLEGVAGDGGALLFTGRDGANPHLCPPGAGSDLDWLKARSTCWPAVGSEFSEAHSRHRVGEGAFGAAVFWHAGISNTFQAVWRLLGGRAGARARS
jgi:hypothetical protein